MNYIVCIVSKMSYMFERYRKNKIILFDIIIYNYDVIVIFFYY